MIDVAWVWDGTDRPYEVPLSVLTEDRQGQLAAMMNVLDTIKVNVRDLKTDRHGKSDVYRRIDFTIDIADFKHLVRVLNALKKVPGVINVERRMAA